MSLKLKENINPEELRKYGFKTGKEWAEQGERCLQGKEYQYNWYHAFLMDEDNADKILYADEEFDQPVIQVSIRTGKDFSNDLYIDCVPSGSYHIVGSDLNIIENIIFDLVKDGLLEKSF